MVNFQLTLHFNLYFYFKNFGYVGNSTYKWNLKCKYVVVFVVFLFLEFAKVKKSDFYVWFQ
jgi:hypothetical protein